MNGEKIYLFTDQELKIPNIYRKKDGSVHVGKGLIEREFKYSRAINTKEYLYGYINPYNDIDLTYTFSINTLPFTDIKRLIDNPYELYLKAMCKHITDNKHWIAKRSASYKSIFIVEQTGISEVTITYSEGGKRYIYVYTRPLIEISNIIMYIKYLCKNDKELNEPGAVNPRLNCLLYYIQGYWLGRGFKPIENLMISMGSNFKVYSHNNEHYNIKPYAPKMNRRLMQHIRDVINLMGKYTTEHLEYKISCELDAMGYSKKDRYKDLDTSVMKGFFSIYVEE